MQPRFHTRIRELRKCPTRRWRQADLAARIGIPRSRLGAYERGDVVPSLARALQIASAHVTTSSLHTAVAALEVEAPNLGNIWATQAQSSSNVQLTQVQEPLT